MKNCLILLSLAIIFISPTKAKSPENKSSSFFMSSSFSSFSSDGINKPERHVRSMKTEEYRDKEENKPEQIRKYGEIFTKDNDKPAMLKKKANSNIEEDGIILNAFPEQRLTLDKSGEKQFMNQMNNNFDNFFKFDKDFSGEKLGGLNVLSISNFNINKEFQNLGPKLSKTKYGNYGKFLDERKLKLVKNLKSTE